MQDFSIDERALEDELRRAARVHPNDVEAVIERARSGEGLTIHEMAVLWCADHASTDTLYRAALETRRPRPAPLETFSPLYMTNTCDAECRMCGMRRDNELLVRETATIATIVEQLRTLVRRGVRAVALLTGEYRGSNREWALSYVNEALRASQELGFRHVLVNVGSIDDDEFDRLFAGIRRRPDDSIEPKVTMCTFQETYSRRAYAKFMGTRRENPRADYDRRLTNFDRAHRAGMRVANPGILVGLNPDLGFELIALASHARHLLERGMETYLSVPRLRQIAGKHDQRGATDEDFTRLVSILALGLPTCKVVITTRENASIQHKLAPIVSVISAGSSAVTPYTDKGARFPLEASQFEVIDQRPFEEILREHRVHSPDIENFHPGA